MNIDNLNKINKERNIELQLMYSITIEALHELKIKYVNNLHIKGKNLLKFLANLSDNLYFKIEKTSTKLILDLEILKSIIDDIYDYSIINSNYNLNKCINIYTNILINKFESSLKKQNKSEPPLKKQKKEFIKDDEDDEDDEEEYYDDEEYYEDEKYKEDEDNNKKIYIKKNIKDSKDFINQVFKVQNERSETEIINYFSNLSNKKRKGVISIIKNINDYEQNNQPILFQILDTDIPINQKNTILKTYTSLISSRMPEKKLKLWFDSLMTIPFGKYKGINLKEIKPKKIKSFLDNLQIIMNKAVYGHDNAKRQIIQMMGQQVRNSNSKGSILGIYGPPGNGKSSLIKEGIAKAINKPFIFISLGGATDASFLEGHSYTYEGSIYGRIIDGLITSKCMDPIIYFDELDKISNTPKGEEITNILIHLTDPVQNSHFRDKYFHGIDIDLSRATMIFSFNNPHNVNHVLMDRITTVETKYLFLPQKIYIAQNHLLPEMIKDMGMKSGDIIISNDAITFIINNWTHEGGVRKLKSLLFSIIREINIANLIKEKINNHNVILPFNITIENIKMILKHKHEIIPEKIHQENTCGVINGLYATSDGSFGGIIPIQILWFPSTIPLDVKATGNLQQVIKESTQVAASLAFNYIDSNLQEKYLLEWKERPKGIHIHCSEGATPKDGPSAGTALTVAIFSLLTERKIRHDIAITGEINLHGNVTAIGGLDNKLEGAKKAGVKFVLFPKENEKDIIQIKERNPNLIDNTFQVQSIETIKEALYYSLI